MMRRSETLSEQIALASFCHLYFCDCISKSRFRTNPTGDERQSYEDEK